MHFQLFISLLLIPLAVKSVIKLGKTNIGFSLVTMVVPDHILQYSVDKRTEK
jgi:hypothetical protein